MNGLMLRYDGQRSAKHREYKPQQSAYKQGRYEVAKIAHEIGKGNQEAEIGCLLGGGSRLRFF